MALYSRKGDDGFTQLPGSDTGARRVRKDDPRIVAAGQLDELNAAIGFCLAEASTVGKTSVREFLWTVQGDLFRAGATLGAVGVQADVAVGLDEASVRRTEDRIDAVYADLPELDCFILPGGCELSARLHLARAVARRAERAAVTALDPAGSPRGKDVPGMIVVKYLSRLSDLLFALARLANHVCGESETRWKP